MKKNSSDKIKNLKQTTKIYRKLAREAELKSGIKHRAQVFRDKTKYHRPTQKQKDREYE